MMSTPRRASCSAISSFSPTSSEMPGDCSPSRRVVSKILTVSIWFSGCWKLQESDVQGCRSNEKPSGRRHGGRSASTDGRPRLSKEEAQQVGVRAQVLVHESGQSASAGRFRQSPSWHTMATVRMQCIHRRSPRSHERIRGCAKPSSGPCSPACSPVSRTRCGEPSRHACRRRPTTSRGTPRRSRSRRSRARSDRHERARAGRRPSRRRMTSRRRGWNRSTAPARPRTRSRRKLSSGIFHVPGGQNYDRTHADRCYVDDDAAASDGLRKSQR